jgi:quercetin 2,3-dioxygenase
VFQVVASPDGRDGSVTVKSDAFLYAGLFKAGQSATYTLTSGRHVWVHVAQGEVSINGHELGAGDAMSLVQEDAISVQGTEAGTGEVLLFDLG